MGLVFFLLTLVLILLRWGYKQPISKSFAWLVVYVVCGILHLVFKGYKWPYLFIYLVPVVYLLDYYFERFKKPSKYLLKLIWLIPVFGFLMLLVFPKVQLDKPDGPYQVGTMVMNFEDKERNEIYDTNKDSREIRVQVFYPTEAVTKNYAPWFLDGEASVKAFAKNYNLPGFFLSHLIEVKSHSLLDVSVAGQGPFPVVIFSHGWKSSRILHLNISEMLASHGYIVFSVDHSYVAAMTRNKDGDIIEYENSVLPKDDFLDEAEVMIEVFSKDIDLTRSQLDFLQATHPILKGAMDLNEVALIGHSTGGGGLVKYLENHEAQALIGLDAWVEPIKNIQALDIPSLFIRSESWLEVENNENLKKITSRIYDIKDSKHQDFTMAEIITPIQKWFGWSGKSSMDIQEEMILNFLDSTLKGFERDLNFESIDRVNLTNFEQ